MDTFELVHQAGLSKKEAAVYAALLDYGHLSISDLYRTTQINRPALYQVLPALERKNLVSRVKQKNRYKYAAESPDRLLRAFEEKVAAETKGLTELSKQFAHRHHDKPVVKYFDGEHGRPFVFDDIIHTLPVGGVCYRYSSRIGTPAKVYEKTLYSRERDKRKIERMVITSAAKAKTKQPKLERSVRAIPEHFDLFEDNISLLIYGPKTAYMDYGSGAALIIESEKIANFHQKLFMLLWKKLGEGRKQR